MTLSTVKKRSTMNTLFARLGVAMAAAILGGTAVAGDQGAASQTLPDPKPRPELVAYAYTKADVEFMQGMIPHHAQAVKMCAMAPTHAGRSEVKLMCERMLISQRDEIRMMRIWLLDRGQYVPPPDATHHKMTMPGGMTHDMLMPGMLSDAEMAALDKARGDAWDRLFLTGMIKHHQGAIKMVDELMAAPGAAQGDDIYAFASDIFADQTAEIERMQKLLEGKESRS
jgi:uncharacterized protein (DUF305 family)